MTTKYYLKEKCKNPHCEIWDDEIKCPACKGNKYSQGADVTELMKLVLATEKGNYPIGRFKNLIEIVDVAEHSSSKPKGVEER